MDGEGVLILNGAAGVVEYSNGDVPEFAVIGYSGLYGITEKSLQQMETS